MRTQRTITILNTARRSETSLRADRTGRRGNTLVLVAGILVLLVIIATSYLTTTQAQRGTSVAQQAAGQRDDNTELIAEMLAAELRDALFAWPIDPEDPALDPTNTWYTGIADANFPRWQPFPDARRYGVDPNFPYNYAPYHTVPFTNWPDWTNDAGADARQRAFNPRRLPWGPGNLFFDVTGVAGDGGAGFDYGNHVGIGGSNPDVALLLSGESNPLGMPGFGDSRWLRDTEPMRWDTGAYPGGEMFGDREAFSHWRKLTNIARANNGWRIVWDISDVDNFIMHDLNVPVEQWLAVRPRLNAVNSAPFNPASGNVNANFLFAGNPGNPNSHFWRQWRAWFEHENAVPGESYTSAYVNLPPLGAPPNLYKLNDLDGTGNIHSYSIGGVRQDTPEAEFIRGTARHTISRVLADTTGDGYTDSFWFLSPTPARGGIRQIVAISIVDNSARLNANVASRFLRSDPDANTRQKTRGHTPADLALVGQLGDPDNLIQWENSWNVGFYDNWYNWGNFDNTVPVAHPQQYRNKSIPETPSDLWRRHLREVGLVYGSGQDILFPTIDDRLDYWQRIGRHGIGYSHETPYTPFGLSDEIELRMFEGNNHPWVYSRFEYTTQGRADIGPGLLRAARERPESSEYRNQLSNRELVRDTRRKLTLYSGVRNDQTSPAMWWENRFDSDWPVGSGLPLGLPHSVQTLATMNPPATYTGDPADWPRHVVNNYITHSRRKIDLREPHNWYHGYAPSGTGGPGGTLGGPRYHANDWRIVGRLNFRDRIASALLTALTDGPDDISSPPTALTDVNFGSYYGSYNINNYTQRNSALNRTRRLAAAYAANILAYRSNQPVTVADTVLLPPFGRPGRPGGAGSQNHLTPGELPGVAATVSYLGIDPQPFLLEVFVGHVYKPTGESVPQFYVPDPEALNADGVDWDCDNIAPEIMEPYGIVPYTNAGATVLLDDASTRSTIVAVQIANPFDVPIDLYKYRITLFGQELELSTVLNADQRWLPPATDDHPVTAIFYSMRDEISSGTGTDVLHASDKWLEFLDLDITNQLSGIAGPNDVLPTGTLVIRVDDTVWSNETRHAYDNRDSLGAPLPDRVEAVVLSRNYAFDVTVPEWRVIDRIDRANDTNGFGRAVNDMYNYKPAMREDPLCTVEPDDDGEFPTYNINADQHWIQWVRATRAWGVDVNGNGFYEAHERSPRFVFGDRAVIVPTSQGTPMRSDGDASFVAPRMRIVTDDGVTHATDNSSSAPGGNRYRFSDPPNDDPLNPRDPWFARKYYTADGILVDGTNPTGAGQTPLRPRKPTFFAMNYGNPQFAGYTGDPAHPDRSYPDKGWYGQYAVDTGALQGVAPEFKTVGLGWIATNPDVSTRRISGVDHPTVLYHGMPFLGGGSTLTWNDPDAPLFRHPFSMQMTLKNKMSVNHFGDPPTFPAWFNALSLPEREQLTAQRDFEQIGEVLNVWLFGHELHDDGGTVTTAVTFAEFMSAENAALTGLPDKFESYDEYEHWLLEGEAHRVNRLRIKPAVDVDGDVIAGAILNRPDPNDFPNPWEYRRDSRHAWAAVPAGARVLDLFVCDGPGRWPYDNTGQIVDWVDELKFYNANEYSGKMTPGMININTATPEVMRALPHLTRMVGEWNANQYPFAQHPFPNVVEAIVRYRDRLGVPGVVTSDVLFDRGPDYAHRGRPRVEDGGFFFDPGAPDEIDGFIPGLRGERGFASLGELGLLTQSGRRGKQWDATALAYLYNTGQINGDPFFDNIDINASYRIDYATMPERKNYELDLPGAPNPFAYLFRGEPVPPLPGWPSGALTSWSARISTDTVDVFNPDWSASGGYPAGMHPDVTAEDAHEANLLLAGISNLVTTRSDTFTVHFRVRSFRQNPVTGVWDATDPEYIVDDTRYVMLVDRSNVNRPSDKPRILYLERLPK